MIPKFRVWDKNNKCMHEVRSIWIGDDFPLNSHVVYSLGNTVEVIFDDIELMQATGLKDKNGVEIFEGDIIKNSNGSTGYVTYLQQEAGFVVVLKKSDYRLGHRNTGESYAEATSHEVIGNIYENPELLDSDLVEVER
ncbi:YopX family protein [Enterococcus mundtii]|uniref:YopX family protein n=1 Tax=Enterococcus mundtii TaxID=53346 RepID=UPI001CCEA8E1|nr:YopX family protein [Enterococcus mundtii]UBM05158.1 YopX family protein [Enterococcus mundtii]